MIKTCLFFKRTLSCCFKDNKDFKIVSQGEENLTKEFNIVKIVKNLRNIKLILKDQKIWTSKNKLKAIELGKHVLKIDDS